MDYQALPPTPAPAPAPAQSFGQRILGALKLDRPTFDEVRRDPGAMTQAAIVIAVTGFASGIGAFFGNTESSVTIDNHDYNLTGSFFTGLLAGAANIVFALVFWVVISLLYRFVAIRLLNSPETNIQWQEVARPIGFASAPSLLSFLTPIPYLGALISFVAGIWAFAAQIVALSETFRVSKLRAFAIILVSGLGATLVVGLIVCICVLAAVALF